MSAEDKQQEEQNERKSLPFREALDFYTAFYRKRKSAVMWVIFYNLLIAITLQTTPIFVKIIVDNYIPAANEWSIYALIIIVFALTMMHNLFAVASAVTHRRSTATVSRDIRDTIVRRLQILSLSYINSKETGRYYSKIMRDVERTERFADVFQVTILRGAFMMAMMVVVLAWVNPKLLGLFLAVFPFYWVIYYLSRRRIRHSQHIVRKAQENLSITVSNFLQTSLLARQHGHEGFERGKVNSSGQRVIRDATSSAADITLYSCVNFTMTNLFNFGVIALAAVSVIRQTLSLGEMLLFVQYVQAVMNLINNLLNQFPILTEFAEGVCSIKEILDAPDVEHNQGKMQMEKVEGRVTFDNVTFAYDNSSEPVLKGVSVDVPPGTSVGLVGKSGSGKSTFVNLLLGLYRNKDGRIMIDEMPVSEIDMRSFRLNVGVVSQSPIIFSGTVYDNIVHAYRDVPMEKVIDAAKKANAHEFIMNLPKGYETWVGESGVLLSGGQKQRLSLARTIMREPSILILDEATSALDSESERLVQEAIDRMMGQITTFIIAHRLSTVQNADVILVFKDGHIIERGSHPELIEKDGEYARLVRFQAMDINGRVLDGSPPPPDQKPIISRPY